MLHLQIQKRCIDSIKIILGISLSISLAFLLFWNGYKFYQANVVVVDGLTQRSNGSFIADSEWLANNLYRCSVYYERDDGKWDVYLVDVEGPTDISFDELKETFMKTPYRIRNFPKLEDGVNCQGMVCYIADWCRENKCPYTVEYFDHHIDIVVDYLGTKYRFDFTENPIITELEGD